MASGLSWKPWLSGDASNWPCPVWPESFRSGKIWKSFPFPKRLQGTGRYLGGSELPLGAGSFLVYRKGGSSCDSYALDLCRSIRTRKIPKRIVLLMKKRSSLCEKASQCCWTKKLFCRKQRYLYGFGLFYYFFCNSIKTKMFFFWFEKKINKRFFFDLMLSLLKSLLSVFPIYF